MDKKELEAFAREVAKSMKTGQDLNDFRQILTKVTSSVHVHSNTQVFPTSIIFSTICNYFKFWYRSFHAGDFNFNSCSSCDT